VVSVSLWWDYLENIHHRDTEITEDAQRLQQFRRRVLRPQKQKRAGASHSPHPKATCPHPTRPLRPPGGERRRIMQQAESNFQRPFCLWMR